MGSPILCLTSPCDNQTPSQHRLCFFFFFSYHKQNRVIDKTVRSRITGMTRMLRPSFVFLMLLKPFRHPNSHVRQFRLTSKLQASPTHQSLPNPIPHLFTNRTFIKSVSPNIKSNFNKMLK